MNQERKITLIELGKAYFGAILFTIWGSNHGYSPFPLEFFTTLGGLL